MRSANSPSDVVPDRHAREDARRSIASRLLWSYLVTSTVPLLLIGVLLIGIDFNTQRENVYNEQLGLASRTSRSIALYLSNFVREFGVFEVFIQPDTGGQNEIRERAADMASEMYPDLLEVSVVDRTAHEIVRTQRVQLAREDELRDLSADPLIQAVMQHDTITFTTTLDAQGANDFVVVMPLHNSSGIVVGALRATIDSTKVIEELRASTDGTSNNAYLYDLRTSALVVNDGSVNFVPPTDMKHFLGATNTVHEYIGARTLSVVGAISPLELSDGRATGWSVVAEKPSLIAFANLRRSIWVLALVVILVDGAVLIWSLRQANDFILPLRALSGGARLVGSGHLDHRITITSNDELGDVASSFNQMAAHLQQSLDEIERQNDRLRHGLMLARDIQLGLLPDRAPWGGDEIAVFARSVPAYEVGGDFYTYIALSEGRAAIAIGDISGKGVGAALLMSLTSSAVESHGRELEHPAEVLSTLNTLLAPRLKASHMNAALMFAVFDPRERMLRVANAGMIAPVLIGASGCRFLDVGGLPIGAFAGAEYRDLTTEIAPGDMLLLLSDGVVEAHNAQGEMFGFDRLEALIATAQPLGDVRALVELILSKVQMFIGEAEQHDDITLVAVRPMFSVEDRLCDEEAQARRYATV
ncbi:SpoIIE family protein phosphatase [Chloroflexia bacterium SDU3-3]|nr:SpoIIE family protein phosphatase [Chloroflexia bacterium SDU3-3]